MSSRTKQHINNQSQKLLVVKTNMMQQGIQGELFKIKKQKPRLSTYREHSFKRGVWINISWECFIYKNRILIALLNNNYIYEMLSTYKSKTKKTNME